MSKKKWDEFSKEFDAEKERVKYEPFLQAARNAIDVEYYVCCICHKEYHLSSEKFDLEIRRCVDRQPCYARGFKHLAKSELFARGNSSKEKDAWQQKEYKMSIQKSTSSDVENAGEISDSST